jgi:hypothetical protein
VEGVPQGYQRLAAHGRLKIAYPSATAQNSQPAAPRSLKSCSIPMPGTFRPRGADARGRSRTDTRKTGSEELELHDKRQRERGVLSASEAPRRRLA